MNFLFNGWRFSEETGRWVLEDRFIGTAGHCAVLGEETRTWARGQGPPAYDASGDRIGELAWAEYPVLDFALIRLDPRVEADPQMCTWGGPTDINNDLTDEPTILRFYGQGTVVSEHQPARTAVAHSMQYPENVMAYGVNIVGDSGAGVISDDGRAVGVLHSGGIAARGGEGDDPLETGNTFITRITPAIATVEGALNLDLRLETAPRT